jgi:hypothetical protein
MTLRRFTVVLGLLALLAGPAAAGEVQKLPPIVSAAKQPLPPIVNSAEFAAQRSSELPPIETRLGATQPGTGNSSVLASVSRQIEPPVPPADGVTVYGDRDAPAIVLDKDTLPSSEVTWADDCLECECEDGCAKCGWHSKDHYLYDWMFRSCNMPQRLPYHPPANGYYYFRPYNHQHIAQQQLAVTRYGGDPRNPYDNRLLKQVYADWRAEQIQGAAPKRPAAEPGLLPGANQEVLPNPLMHNLRSHPNATPTFQTKNQNPYEDAEALKSSRRAASR